MRTGACRLATLAVSLTLSLATMQAANAATRAQIDVFPGPHALSDALAEAQPGDTLVLHTGTYPEAVTISTASITVEPAGDGPVTIDAACSSIAVVNIRADGVTLLGPMTVTGGLFYGLNYLSQRSGVAQGITIPAACGGGSDGIFLQRVGALTVSSNVISGFLGPGIEVFGVTGTGGGRLVLSSNEVSGSGRGITVQDSSGGSIQLVGNRLHDDQFSGINLLSSAGVLIQRNATTNDGTDGIQLDADSSSNLVVGNVARGNAFDLDNGGSNNCFKRNRFVTSNGTIGC